MFFKEAMHCSNDHFNVSVSSACLADFKGVQKPEITNLIEYNACFNAHYMTALQFMKNHVI